jgi:hypothetical protein
MKDGALTAPHNQLGEPATTTTEETVSRLQEKASHNNGGANRERIRARIAARFKNARATSLQLPQRRGWGSRGGTQVARKSGRAMLWIVAFAVVLIGVISASRSTPLMKMSRHLYQGLRR